MNSHELIEPNTNLYGMKDRIGLRSLADVRETPKQIAREEVGSMPAELVPNEAYMLGCSSYAQEIQKMSVATNLDYGEDVEGLLLTTKY